MHRFFIQGTDEKMFTRFAGAERICSWWPAGPVRTRANGIYRPTSAIMPAVACAGPLATRSCEPRQAWKGAAAAVDLGAGVWLVQVTLI